MSAALKIILFKTVIGVEFYYSNVNAWELRANNENHVCPLTRPGNKQTAEKRQGKVVWLSSYYMQLLLLCDSRKLSKPKQKNLCYFGGWRYHASTFQLEPIVPSNDLITV